MKVEKSELKRVVKILKKVVMVNKNKPILSFVKLSTHSDGSAYVNATNFEQVLKVRINAEIEKVFEVLILFKDLEKLSKRKANDPIEIDYEYPLKVIVSGGNFKRTLEVPSLDDFPNTEFGDFELTPIDSRFAENFCRAMRFVLSGPSRYAIQAVCLDEKGFTGTNGKALGHFRGETHTEKFLALPCLAQFLADADSIGFKDGYVYVSSEGYVLRQREADGQYPTYKDVIPSHKDYAPVVYNVKELIESLPDLAATTELPNKAVAVHLNSLIKLSTESDEGKTEVTLTGGCRETLDFGIGLDYLELTTEFPEFQMHVNEPREAILFKPKSGGSRIIVMPISLGD